MEIICLKKQNNIVQRKKTKIVLEAIKAEMTIAQISSRGSCNSNTSMEQRDIENLVSGFQVKPATKEPDSQELIKQLYE